VAESFATKKLIFAQIDQTRFKNHSEAAETVL
jgi:hypothetical protein